MEFYCQKFANKKGEGDFDTLGQELLIAISSTFFDRMTRFLAWWLIFSRSTHIFSEIEDWRSFQNVLTLFLSFLGWRIQI